MLKIRDKITLGAIAGFFSNIIVSIIDIIFYMLNITKYIHIHIAASTFFPVSKVHTVAALIVGTISDFSLAVFLGVIIAYILFYTGTDFFYVKGLGVAMVFWLVVYGIVLRTHVGRIDPTDSGTNLVHLAIHLILGFLTAWIISTSIVPLNNKR